MITIDGPAGAGKSTVARALARQLGYRLLDTGAMYRAAALSVHRAGLAAEEGTELRRHLATLEIDVEGDRVVLNGEDVTAAIRDPEIGTLTSWLSTLPAVRERVVPFQRRAAAAGGVVLEGRDTGTAVCPDAEVKFYLGATHEERARRRQAELRAQGVATDFATVFGEIGQRDRQDTTRALSPLRVPEGAIVIDTTTMSVAEVVERMLREIEQRCCTQS